MARAQSTVEYALIVATVAILVLAGGAAFGEALYRWLSEVLARLPLTM